NYGSWRALAAPTGTPDEIVTKLETLFMQAAQTDEFVEFMTNGGFTIDLLDKAGFEARWTEQLDLIGKACDIYNQQY
ncbi:MAG: tripartite tricarboxylate transporter substrate-binding protein, partial [Candidatus Pacebacteria bacterium]|nr:tripartite tricarboxylate transporter substrate-binding protein [Candidatus Paceibacterota bacterium]